MKTLKTTKISDYFKYEKNPRLKIIQNLKNKTDMTSDDDMISTDSTNIKISKSDNNFNLTTKFKLPKTLNENQKNIINESLIRALIVKNIEFNDDLCYTDPDCCASKNDASLEVGIQKMDDINKQIYYKFKERTRKGEYPPVEIIDDELQGFIVRAIDDIPMLTLICEYTGEVTFARKKLFDRNDSIMDLIRTPSSSSSLVICPEKKGNLARFISGINNYNSKSSKKLNVNSIRFNIDGSVHVLLYAARLIKKNEILYYDYNAGGHEGYPTQNFI